MSSFRQNILNEIKTRIAFPMKKGYLFAKKKDFNQTYAKDFDYLHPSIAIALNKKMINQLKIINKPLNIWTFKTDDEVKKINNIYGSQVHGYISDNPNLNIF